MLANFHMQLLLLFQDLRCSEQAVLQYCMTFVLGLLIFPQTALLIDLLPVLAVLTME